MIYKNFLKKSVLLFSSTLLMFSCSEFEEINTNPTAASIDQVQVEYFINKSIVGAQQNPHIAERIFVLYWKAAGRMDRINSLPVGYTNDGWTSDYFNGYASNWLNHINTAVQVAEEKAELGTVKTYTNNLKQFARIWRAYLMSEMADNFGPIPVDGFKGINPDFDSVKDVYYFALKELKEAVAGIDESVTFPDNVKKLDPAFSYDNLKWKKYGNSLRMRLAMRLSGVDTAKAKAEFEDAAKGGIYMTDLADNFEVQENNGWDDLTGVMTRQWNNQYLSPTLNNLMIGLGGILSADQLDASVTATIKPDNYLGAKYENHFTSLTNDPSAGYFFDGLHNKIDPRAYKAYIIPGYLDHPEFNRYPSWASGNVTDTKRNLEDADGNVVKEIDAAFSWNTPSIGSWGAKGAINKVYSWPGAQPRLANKFRNGSTQRIFFASWEAYFLLAEAKVRGWDVSISAKDAYETGVAQNFEYWGVSSNLAAYLISTNYNRAGTSVSWGHITEPVDVTMSYVDGYTGVAGTVNYKYPENPIYKGNAKNDLLSKIITQKFIAQTPWLPLETWSDHRRLGLPFFENPAVENPLTNMPALTSSNYMTNKVAFYPQRLKYPSNLESNVPEGYKQAVDLLGKPDDVFTSLWWAQQ